MHILVLPSWFESPNSPTLGSFFKDQAKSIAKQGVNVGIIYPQATSIKNISNWYSLTEYQEHSPKLAVIKKAYFTMPFFWSYNAKRRLEQFEQLYLLYCNKYGKPDIIHAHSTFCSAAGGAGIAANLIGSKYNLPFIITEHSSMLRKKAYRLQEIDTIKQACQNAQTLIAVSPSLSHDLTLFSEINNIQVIGNVVDTTCFYPKKVTHKKFRLIVVAHLRPIKQIDKIIYAFAAALKKVDSMSLTIIGDGRDKEKLIKLATELKIIEHTIFTGELPRKEVAQRMMNSDCYISASEYETFGVSIYEAISCGLSIITTPCEGPEEMINKINETVLTSFSIPELTDAIIKKRLKPRMSNQKKQEQHQLINNHFSNEAIGSKLVEVLKLAHKSYLHKVSNND